MLDLSPLAAPAREAARRACEREERARNAAALAAEIANDTIETTHRSERVRQSRTSWLAARPLDNVPPGQALPLPSSPPSDCYVAVATDGSQIAPDPRTEGDLGCALLHVGRVFLPYGPGAPRPRLDSRAELLLTDDAEETEEGTPTRLVGLRRFAMEMREMAGLIEETAASGIPAVALTDGSLIAWALDDETGQDVDKQEALAALFQTLAIARERRIPLVGYISQPGARDVVHSLRIGALCPEEPVDCRRCPHLPEALPCAPVAPATDARLFARLLTIPGERSPVFSARGQATGFSQVLRLYQPADWIGFFYLNVGPEIARIELPLWIAEDADLLNQVHALCFDQARKGRGYPVALAEAHERAVVRAADREAFRTLLTRALVREAAPAASAIAPTRKALAKRLRSL